VLTDVRAAVDTAMPAFIPSPGRGVWHLGPLPVRAYALIILLGIVVAVIVADRR
jgi:prolipoprotein diacylglyceryltransferase